MNDHRPKDLGFLLSVCVRGIVIHFPGNCDWGQKWKKIKKGLESITVFNQIKDDSIRGNCKKRNYL